MAKDKQLTLSYIVIALLVINTLFLGGIFFKLCCIGGTSFCPYSKTGSGAICPFAKKGSMKGS